MTLDGTSLIGFSRGAVHGPGSYAEDPASGEALEPAYQWASGDEVDQACELAAAAAETLGRTPPGVRAALLRAVADGLEPMGDAIVARANRETALPLPRLTGELARTTGQLRLFAALLDAGWWVDARIDHGDPARQPLPKPDLRSMLRPVGPVAVFSASNFPLAFSVAGGDTAAALAAGCPVVVKAHHGHLGTSELVGGVIVAAVRAAGLPAGVFSLLFGPGREVGLRLVRHPAVRAVGFTGSRSGGRALMDAAAARPEPIPVYAEMGSINPLVILPGALAERAEALATGLASSVTLGVGQFCTNPGLVCLPSGPAGDAFLDRLAALLAATPPGVMLTPGMCGAYQTGLAQFAQRPGVEQRVAVTAGPQAGGAAVGAALLVTAAAAFVADRELLHEVFGPATLVVRYHDAGELLAVARALEGQLTATVHAGEGELAEHGELVAVLESKVGRLLCGGFPTGVEVCHAMVHGGPYPATSDGRSTSVGTRAIGRFARAVSYQNWPEAALPPELQEANPLGVPRLVDGTWQ